MKLQQKIPNREKRKFCWDRWFNIVFWGQRYGTVLSHISKTDQLSFFLVCTSMTASFPGWSNSHPLQNSQKKGRKRRGEGGKVGRKKKNWSWRNSWLCFARRRGKGERKGKEIVYAPRITQPLTFLVLDRSPKSLKTGPNWTDIYFFRIWGGRAFQAG